jgi:hypothetical protein
MLEHLSDKVDDFGGGYPAYQFPDAASLRMALSNSASARSFFRRTFSFSTSFSRLA